MANKQTVKFLEDVKFLDLKFAATEIANSTGFSRSNVSEYLRGKREPSKNFLKKFYAVYFPDFKFEIEAESKEPIIPYMTTEEYIRSLLKQIKDKDMLIEMLQEKNKQLTEENQSYKAGKAGGRHRSA